VTHPDDLAPQGVLVIDGEALRYARDAGDVREIDPRDLTRGIVAPEAVLVRTMRAPRRQRVGGAAVVARALEDLPFYTLPARLDETAKALCESLATPLDRWVAIGAPATPGTIGAADDSVEALLAAVFADLPTNRPPSGTPVSGTEATARLHAKWYFGDVKRVLATVLGPLARRHARANRPLRLAHIRCGDGALSFAVDPAIAYIGIDDRPDYRNAAAARLPDADILAPDDLSRGTVGELGAYLFTDVIDLANAEAAIETLRPVAALSAREALVVGLLPHDPGAVGHGVIDEPRVNRLGVALARSFGGTCELHRLATIAHKPLDALPGTVLVAFEVNR